MTQMIEAATELRRGFNMFFSSFGASWQLIPKLRIDTSCRDRVAVQLVLPVSVLMRDLVQEWFEVEYSSFAIRTFSLMCEQIDPSISSIRLGEDRILMSWRAGCRQLAIGAGMSIPASWIEDRYSLGDVVGRGDLPYVDTAVYRHDSWERWREKFLRKPRNEIEKAPTILSVGAVESLPAVYAYSLPDQWRTAQGSPTSPNEATSQARQWAPSSASRVLHWATNSRWAFVSEVARPWAGHPCAFHEAQFIGVCFNDVAVIELLSIARPPSQVQHVEHALIHHCCLPADVPGARFTLSVARPPSLALPSADMWALFHALPVPMREELRDRFFDLSSWLVACDWLEDQNDAAYAVHIQRLRELFHDVVSFQS